MTTHEDTHPILSYGSHVIIEDTLFEGNAGFILELSTSAHDRYTMFNRCSFRNNFASKRGSGHVYGTGQVDFKNCSFTTSLKNLAGKNTTFDKSIFLYSESGGPVMFENTSVVLTIG